MAQTPSESIEVKIRLSRDVYERLEGLAKSISVSVDVLVSNLVDVLSSYSSDISSLTRDLRVSKEKLPVSIFEELVFYGVEAWRSIANSILEAIGARGSFELESIDFEPLEPLLELEFVAFEGSEFKADRLVVAWSTRGVSLEVYYYLEDKPKPAPRISIAYEWSYLPDEHAVVVSIVSDSIAKIPSLAEIDKEASKLGI
ncbi:MAG: hypothetical protein QXO93_05320 [Acidilobaceae archaeon]